VTWFLARLGEIIEDFPLTVPVEVDEAHQCVSRLSRCEEMQIWSRGHVPLGVWFSVFLILFAGLWDMWSPSRSWTFLLDSEDCLSELKSNYSNENRDRPNWSCVRSGDDSNLHVWSLWLHRKQTKVWLPCGVGLSRLLSSRAIPLGEEWTCEVGPPVWGILCVAQGSARVSML